MFGRDPNSHCVLDCEHEDARSIEELQILSVIQLDLRQRLCDRPGDIAKDQDYQDSVDDAGPKIPATSVLQDFERPPTRCRKLCFYLAHLALTEFGHA